MNKERAKRGPSEVNDQLNYPLVGELFLRSLFFSLPFLFSPFLSLFFLSSFLFFLFVFPFFFGKKVPSDTDRNTKLSSNILNDFLVSAYVKWHANETSNEVKSYLPGVSYRYPIDFRNKCFE